MGSQVCGVFVVALEAHMMFLHTPSLRPDADLKNFVWDLAKEG